MGQFGSRLAGNLLIDGFRKVWSLANFWVNYNDLTATSLEIMVSKGNHPQMALMQVGELL